MGDQFYYEEVYAEEGVGFYYSGRMVDGRLVGVREPLCALNVAC